jgi:hypothetical protein
VIDAVTTALPAIAILTLAVVTPGTTSTTRPLRTLRAEFHWFLGQKTQQIHSTQRPESPDAVSEELTHEPGGNEVAQGGKNSRLPAVQPGGEGASRHSGRRSRF